MVLLIDQNPQIDLNRALSCARPLHPQGVFKVRVGVNNNLLAPVMGGVGGSCSVRGPRGWPDPIPHMVSLPYYTIWPLHMSSSPSAHPHPDQANILQSLPGFPFEANLLQFKAQDAAFVKSQSSWAVCQFQIRLLCLCARHVCHFEVKLSSTQ